MAASKVVWVGRILSWLVSAFFLFSATMKFMGGPDLEVGMKHLELPMTIVFPLAILELACAIIYLIPATAVTGAVLLTGYMGGAILTHWRVGDPVYTQILIALVVWLGIYLQEPRLKALLPLRR